MEETSMQSRGQSMTPEEWYDCSKPKHKRTKHDSPLFCPYCGSQFNMTGERFINYHRACTAGRTPTTVCKKCGREFYYRNYSAAYCREHELQATWKKGE